MYFFINWLNRLCKSVFLVALLVPPLFTSAQDSQILTLDDAFKKAGNNFPLIRQKDLSARSKDLSVQNLRTGYLPQVNMNAQGTYQSEVTKLDIPIPGIKVEQLSKDQYKATADISQVLFDGGAIREQIMSQELTRDIEENKVDVELYNLKNRIFQLYFTILYQQELLTQTGLLVKDIQTGIDKVKAQVKNGTSLRSNLLELEAQLLVTNQRIIEIRSTQKGLFQALSVLLNENINDNTRLMVPKPSISQDTAIIRPELTLFANQQKLFESQKSLINARNRPKASAFMQGGYGRPGLNFLSNDFSLFYIGGLRINWTLGNLYTAKREKELLEVSVHAVDLQREAFLQNTQSQLVQQEADINKYRELVNNDEEIIEIRQKISDAAKAQLENAVITANDYVEKINAEDKARQTKIIHQMQLLQAQTNYAITTGNF
ncbi:hypothetical protein BH20BAC1_BH20BAC1_26640 [soil metagenome]